MGAKYDNRITEVILESINIVDLISEYTPLKRTGRNYKGLCPFHNEKTPSFSVSEDKQFYHCFGCGVGGDAIKFVQEIENFDFLDAIEYLADKYGVDIDAYKNTNSGKAEPAIPPEVKKALYAISREAAIMYYKELPKSSEAMEYIKRRGLDQSIIKKFGLGFAPDDWHFVHKRLSKNDRIEKLLIRAGLVAKSPKGNVYDYFRNRIMFPIRDIKGNVIAFGGRVMDGSNPKYLNSPETDIFNKSNTLYGLNLAKNTLSDSRQVIVTEGYMDVISLHQQGVENAVATLGTALTTQHGRILSRYADEIVICYDSDSAGQKAALRSIDVLQGLDAKVKILTLGDNMDPDDFIRSKGRTEFENRVKTAKSTIDFRLDLIRVKLDLRDDEDRIDYVKGAVEIFKSVKDAVQRNIYIDKVAKQAMVDPALIKQEIGASSTQPADIDQDFVQRRPDNVETAVRKKKDHGPLLTVEKRLLEIALDSKKGFEMLMSDLDINDLQFEHIRSIFLYLRGYYEKYDTFKLNIASDDMDLKLATGIEKLMNKHIPIENLQKETLSTKRTHRELVLRKRLSDKKDEVNMLTRSLSHERDDIKEKQELLRKLFREQQQIAEEISRVLNEKSE
ncbi:DNA primase [Fusibacter sp. JL216-2]|uniref:DNA primase n=1 Tax=Fusibacter sp. JL216-2 TaxID=3071453 RepID=UPI003D32E086